MLTQTAIESALLTWMQEFLEQPNPNLGNWAPCPYARAARVNNKIKIVKGTLSGDDIVELINTPERQMC